MLRLNNRSLPTPAIPSARLRARPSSFHPWHRQTPRPRASRRASRSRVRSGWHRRPNPRPRLPYDGPRRAPRRARANADRSEGRAREAMTRRTDPIRSIRCSSLSYHRRRHHSPPRRHPARSRPTVLCRSRRRLLRFPLRLLRSPFHTRRHLDPLRFESMALLPLRRRLLSTPHHRPPRHLLRSLLSLHLRLRLHPSRFLLSSPNTSFKLYLQCALS